MTNIYKQDDEAVTQRAANPVIDSADILLSVAKLADGRTVSHLVYLLTILSFERNIFNRLFKSRTDCEDVTTSNTSSLIKHNIFHIVLVRGSNVQ